MHFPERPWQVSEVHDSQARGDAVKAIVGKWQIVRIGMLETDIGKPPL
jgi:hypothetical protein